MPYSTVAEVRAAVSDVGLAADPPTEQTGTAADLSNETLADAIAEADSTIDAYIGGHYATPINLGSPPALSAPHPIDFWSRNIAAYLATISYRQNQDFADTDPVARRYNATMLALTAVRDGKATLPGDFATLTDLDPSQGEGAGAPMNTYDGADLFQPRDFGLVCAYDDVPRWWR